MQAIDFGGKNKSLSVKPSILWVQVLTSTFPHDR